MLSDKDATVLSKWMLFFIGMGAIGTIIVTILIILAVFSIFAIVIAVFVAIVWSMFFGQPMMFGGLGLLALALI